MGRNMEYDDSDFIFMGETLRRNKLYLRVAEKLKNEGKYKLIETDGTPYLERYTYINLRPFVRVVIHRFLKSDDDGLHDHPWAFQNYILEGGYWEHTQEGKFWREPGYVGSRNADFLHRVELDYERSGNQVWTLFMMGQREKSWGFLDENGVWIDHQIHLGLKENGKG